MVKLKGQMCYAGNNIISSTALRRGLRAAPGDCGARGARAEPPGNPAPTPPPASNSPGGAGRGPYLLKRAQRSSCGHHGGSQGLSPQQTAREDRGSHEEEGCFKEGLAGGQKRRRRQPTLRPWPPRLFSDLTSQACVRSPSVPEEATPPASSPGTGGRQRSLSYLTYEAGIPAYGLGATILKIYK
uniref:Uncharacterized protein n=1 Tax=Rangifer tarandus platyrhynchus TaxID=3082113 RepID=A0ACB0FHM4_RANTA|nr:unnamed protein product [Rangifer tarandus platyrhynchus]